MNKPDIEKTILQVEDALPNVRNLVEKYKRYVEDLEKTFAEASTKISKKKLQDSLGAKQELRNALSYINNLIITLDKLPPEVIKSKRMDVARKGIELAQLELLEQSKKMGNLLSEIAEGKLPKEMKKFATELFQGLKVLLAPKLEIEEINKIIPSGKKNIFAYYLKVVGDSKNIPSDASSKVSMYVVLTQDLEEGKEKDMYLAVFRNVLKRPPYEKGAWKVLTSPSMKDFERILSIFDAQGATGLINVRKRPKTVLKVSKKNLEELKAQDWVIDVKVAIPFITVIVKPLAIEGFDANTLKRSRKVSQSKFLSIVTNIRKLMLADKRKLATPDPVIIKTQIKGPNKKLGTVYKITVKFIDQKAFKFLN